MHAVLLAGLILAQLQTGPKANLNQPRYQRLHSHAPGSKAVEPQFNCISDRNGELVLDCENCPKGKAPAPSGLIIKCRNCKCTKNGPARTPEAKKRLIENAPTPTPEGYETLPPQIYPTFRPETTATPKPTSKSALPFRLCLASPNLRRLTYSPDGPSTPEDRKQDQRCLDDCPRMASIG